MRVVSGRHSIAEPPSNTKFTPRVEPVFTGAARQDLAPRLAGKVSGRRSPVGPRLCLTDRLPNHLLTPVELGLARSATVEMSAPSSDLQVSYRSIGFGSTTDYSKWFACDISTLGNRGIEVSAGRLETDQRTTTASKHVACGAGCGYT